MPKNNYDYDFNNMSNYDPSTNNNTNTLEPEIPDNKVELSKTFENLTWVVKIILGLFIIVIVSLNRYIDFIKTNPISFSVETIIYSIIGTIPFLFMEKYRKHYKINC